MWCASDVPHIGNTGAPSVVAPYMDCSAGDLSSGQSYVVRRFVITVFTAVVLPFRQFLVLEPVVKPFLMLSMALRAICVVAYHRRFHILVGLIAYRPEFGQNYNVLKGVLALRQK